MKRIALAAAIALTAALTANAAHTIIPDTIVGSRIYPGTTHTLQYYIPDRYTPADTACLIIGLDGITCRAPAVIDSLIAIGAMPLTVGIFLQPGTISDTTGQVIRYNRSNEFDATTDRFATFLEQEVIPRAAAHGIRISPRPQDRMIYGLSSGGIAAFLAAWHRPDLFSRVFTAVGTYVSMRGGNDLPLWIRKNEPRPLKIFLQDGTQDVWNPIFGHWYEANQLMASALDFAGYTVRYDWTDTGHNARRATEILPEVLTWLWHGHPYDIQPGTTSNGLLAEILIPGATWQPAATVATPAAPTDTITYYPDRSIAVIHRTQTNCLDQVIITPDGPAHRQPFYWLHNYDNALLHIGPMAFDSNGNLWVTTNAGIQILDQNGRVRAILDLPTPNVTDWVTLQIQNGSITLTAADGTAYTRRLRVTAPTPGLRPRSQGQG